MTILQRPFPLQLCNVFCTSASIFMMEQAEASSSSSSSSFSHRLMCLNKEEKKKTQTSKSSFFNCCSRLKYGAAEKHQQHGRRATGRRGRQEREREGGVGVRVAQADWRWLTTLHCTCNTTYSLCKGVGEPAFFFSFFWRLFSIWRNCFFKRKQYSVEYSSSPAVFLFFCFFPKNISKNPLNFSFKLPCFLHIVQASK